MKVIFMGTPDFSVGTLEALIGAGHEVVLVVTQPDKPKGRGGKMQYTPVKEAAVAHGIPVFQPVKIREPEAVEELRKYNADIMVVIAFGQILPKEILDMTPYGCINVHASLLPSYRGAAPIQWAVINGDKVSGVTTMQMNEGLDTGDMIMKTEVPLSEDETGGSLHDKLAEAGAKLCVETLKALEDKTARSLGINVNAMRIVISLIAVLLASISTAVAGVISFLGLIVPHIGRILVGSDHKALVPFSALFGAFTFLLADTIGRTIAAPYEVSASIIMSVVGGPFFIILLRRSKKYAK